MPVPRGDTIVPTYCRSLGYKAATSQTILSDESFPLLDDMENSN